MKKDKLIDLIQQKCDITNLDGDCYLGVFYFDKRGIAPNDIGEVAGNLVRNLENILRPLNVTIELLIIPHSKDSKFELYSMVRK